MDSTKQLAGSAEGVENFKQERERMHRFMLSAVSHDLKTPLSSIIGSLEIYEKMKDKLTPEKQQTLIMTALSEAYRLDNFITNILDMTKLESGAVSIKNEQFDLYALLEDCVLRLNNSSHGTIKINDLPGTIIINNDQSLICRAVTLLLDNALKYSGPQPSVDLEYGREGEDYFIAVKDSGPGIPDSMKDKIFSKYTRLQKQDHQNAGTGLGLAICREIMSLTGGTVTVGDNPSGGAVFKITFPSLN